MSAAVCAQPPVMVDVAFELHAPELPADYEWPLYHAMVRVAPWLASAHYAGIHPVRATRTPEGGYLVARRTKLVVRMPRDRICAASILEGAALELEDGTAVRLGTGTLRKFEPAPTLYAARVVTGDTDEGEFSARLTDELAGLGIHRPLVCGRRSKVLLDGKPVTAFSVAVHGLGDAASLLLQNAGLGLGRAIGCGLFVPHKTITAPE